jgi:hypothetical protein
MPDITHFPCLALLRLSAQKTQDGPTPPHPPALGAWSGPYSHFGSGHAAESLITGRRMAPPLHVVYRYSVHYSF